MYIASPKFSPIERINSDAKKPLKLIFRYLIVIDVFWFFIIAQLLSTSIITFRRYRRLAL